VDGVRLIEVVERHAAARLLQAEERTSAGSVAGGAWRLVRAAGRRDIATCVGA
jgi:hypothetical protein